MSLRAKLKVSTRDKDGNLVLFNPGEPITGVTKAEEKRLIDVGAAEKGTATEKGE